MVTLEEVGVRGAMAMHKINIKLPSAGLALAEASTCVYPVSCSQIETTTTANKAHTHKHTDRQGAGVEGGGGGGGIVGSGNALKVKSKNKSIYVKHFCYKGY